jgi:hypothetical protein
MDIKQNVLKPQIKDIFNLWYAKDCFELKLHLLRSGYAEMNEYERNEVDIERIKCEIAVLRLQKLIRQKTKDFRDNLTLFEFAQED